MAMKRQVKAWAVVTKKGKIRGNYSPAIFMSKISAKLNVVEEGERVIPVTVQWEEE